MDQKSLIYFWLVCRLPVKRKRNGARLIPTVSHPKSRRNLHSVWFLDQRESPLTLKFRYTAVLRQREKGWSQSLACVLRRYRGSRGGNLLNPVRICVCHRVYGLCHRCASSISVVKWLPRDESRPALLYLQVIYIRSRFRRHLSPSCLGRSFFAPPNVRHFASRVGIESN